MRSYLALGSKAHRLERRQWVPGELDDVFAFFRDPLNLKLITPPWLGFEVRNMSTSTIETGTIITYRVRWMGLPMKWVTLIEDWKPNVRFVDSALVSPYIVWRHEHRFDAVAGGVSLVDRVDYRLPFGPFGDLAHRLMVQRQLEGIFDYRARVVADRMSGGAVQDRPPHTQSPNPST